MKRALYILVLSLLVAVAANLAIGALVPPGVGSDHYYLLQYRHQLHRTQAQVALIGNSMLDEGVEVRTLSHLLQRRCVKLVKGGSASAAWYLILKNAVVPAEQRPETAVIFFRDIFLTHPTYRIDGNFRKYIRDVSAGEEPLLQQLGYKTDATERFLTRIFPAYGRRKLLTDRLDHAVKDNLVAGVLGLKNGDVDAAIGRVFADNQMNAEIATREQEAAESVHEAELYDFDKSLPASFLPHIIALAEQTGIRLIFVRIKRRSHALGRSDSAPLKAYIENLRAYLDRRHIPLLDFTQNPKIKIQHYGKGDHLNRDRGRRMFTYLLGRELEPVLPPARKPAKSRTPVKARKPLKPYQP